MEGERESSVADPAIAVAPELLAPQIVALVDDLARLVAELAFEGLLPAEPTQSPPDGAMVNQ